MNRPRLPRRFLAAAAVVVSVAIAATACDSSPYAASVNSQVIKQTTLNAELKGLASDPIYVQAQSQAAQQQQGYPVQGSAAGSTYNLSWVNQILEQMVLDSAVHQYLSARGQLPSADMLTAATGVEALTYSQRGEWTSLPASYRQRVVQLVADVAALIPNSNALSSAKTSYSQVSKYLFSQVCTRAIDFSVDGANGKVDYAQSLAAATDIQQTYAALRQNPSLGNFYKITSGVVTCYTPEQLAEQTPAFYDSVVPLGVNQTTQPQRTPYGYSLVAVESRKVVPFTQGVAKVLTLVNASGLPPQLKTVLDRSRIKLNPQYGTWNNDLNGHGPGILGPAAPSGFTS